MMTPDSGYGPFPKRRGRGNVLTYFLTAALGAGLGTVLLLALTDSDSSGATLTAGGHGTHAPAGTGPPALKSQQDIVAKVKPGVVIIDTMLQYNSEAAAGTGVVLKSEGTGAHQ